jgi:hypothetical protein
MIAIQQSERNGKVVAATLVRPADEIMLITDKGVLVRTRVAEIRELGRATQGVTLIALDDGTKLSGLQRIVENDAHGPIPAPKTDNGPRRRTDEDPLILLGAAAVRLRRWRRRQGRRAPAKKELVAKVLQLQQPTIEADGAQLAEQPAAQMMQQAGPALQRSCRPSGARPSRSDIEADARKYAEEAVPDRARTRREAGADDHRRRCWRSGSPRTSSSRSSPSSSRR